MPGSGRRRLLGIPYCATVPRSATNTGWRASPAYMASSSPRHHSSNRKLSSRLRSRHPDRRPSGKRNRCCRSPGAASSAAENSLHGNSRSDAWPASAYTAQRFGPRPDAVHSRWVADVLARQGHQARRPRSWNDRGLQMAVVALRCWITSGRRISAALPGSRNLTPRYRRW